MSIELVQGEALTRFVEQVRRNLERVNLPPPIPESVRAERKLRTALERALPEASRDIGDILVGPRLLSVCDGLNRYGGYILAYELETAGPITTFTSTDLIPFPFMVTHIGIAINTAFGTGSSMAIAVSADTLTTQDSYDQSLPMILPQSQLSNLPQAGATNMEQLYPNFLVPVRDRAIKYRFRNNAAGNATCKATIDLVRLG